MSHNSIQTLSDRLSSLPDDASRIDALFDAMRSVLADRNSSYSSTPDSQSFSNIRSSSRINIPPHVGCFIRMMDKFSRLENLVRDNKSTAIDGERMIDTALDLANYALIFITLSIPAGDTLTKTQAQPPESKDEDWYLAVGSAGGCIGQCGYVIQRDGFIYHCRFGHGHRGPHYYYGQHLAAADVTRPFPDAVYDYLRLAKVGNDIAIYLRRDGFVYFTDGHCLPDFPPVAD